VQDGDEDDPPVWQQLLKLCEERVLHLNAQVQAKEAQLQALQQGLEVQRQQLEVERQRREEAHARIAELYKQQVPRVP
jgi:hypothetical protein